jgi:glycosyltransferase involved in cell wall biosynthesis
MVGSGQTRSETEAFVAAEGLANVEFIDWMTLEDLREETERADICLGIFGGGGKAGRVIPHKVYAALAMGIPVITADTPAATERLEDRRTALLCRPDDPEALAKCILELASDEQLRHRMSEAGNRLYESCFDSASVSTLVVDVFERVIGGRGRQPR